MYSSTYLSGPVNKIVNSCNSIIYIVCCLERGVWLSFHHLAASLGTLLPIWYQAERVVRHMFLLVLRHHNASDCQIRSFENAKQFTFKLRCYDQIFNTEKISIGHTVYINMLDIHQIWWIIVFFSYFFFLVQNVLLKIKFLSDPKMLNDAALMALRFLYIQLNSILHT